MRLYNGHKQVLFRRSVDHKALNRLKRQPHGWRSLLADDVVKYVDDLKSEGLAGGEDAQRKRVQELMFNPAMFFARPKNVPCQMRKQVYLPNFVITLMRTKHLPPKYASFWVPLWFNKLDFKNYLKNVYNVDVLHVRSFVQQQKVQRKEYSRNGRPLMGPWYRPCPRKKMTVELIDPFVYPEEEKDLSPWEVDTRQREMREGYEASQEGSREVALKPKKKAARETIAEQAQRLLQGESTWKPTWHSIPADARVFESTSRPPGIRRNL